MRHNESRRNNIKLGAAKVAVDKHKYPTQNVNARQIPKAKGRGVTTCFDDHPRVVSYGLGVCRKCTVVAGRAEALVGSDTPARSRNDRLSRVAWLRSGTGLPVLFARFQGRPVSPLARITDIDWPALIARSAGQVSDCSQTSLRNPTKTIGRAEGRILRGRKWTEKTFTTSDAPPDAPRSLRFCGYRTARTAANEIETRFAVARDDGWRS